MQIPLPIVWIAALAFVGLLYGMWRSRRDVSELRDRVEISAGDLERLQTSFSRFAPEEIVESIVASGVASEGERKEVTALFADLVGYTALSESIDPTVQVRILNGYFERMSRAITEHRGHVSTFVGDGILALFGALRPNPWQGNDAVHAALAMRRELAEYNDELDEEGLPTLSIGVGLHRGVGVTGLVGSRDLIQFAFVGRVVNLASRVQDLTRQYGVDILLTGAVQQDLNSRFVLRELPPTEVRGVADPVVIFAAEEFDG